MRVKIAVVSVVAVYAWSTGAQDLIRLRSGATIRGKAISYKDGKLVVRGEDGRLTCGAITEVDEIEFGHFPAALGRVPGDGTARADRAVLQGNDLVAWKLARSAAEDKCRQLNPAANSGVSSNTAWGARSQYPKYELDPQPTQNHMQKTGTGDWVFSLPVDASYHNVKNRERIAVREKIVVRVVDYGEKMRVEECRLERAK